MPVDYKYTHPANTGRRKARPLRFLIVPLMLLFVAATVYGALAYETRQIDEWILTGRAADAEKVLRRWTWMPLIDAYIYEQLGTSTLIARGASSAGPFFQKSESKYLFKPAGIWQEVLKLLWGTGRYEDGLHYTKHLEKQPPDVAVVRFYEAGFLAGLNSLQDAAEALKAIGPLPELTNEISMLKAEIDHRLATNQYSFVGDRNELTVATIDMNKKVSVRIDQFYPLLKNRSGDYMAELAQADALNKAVLTIDYRIQNAALSALGRYAGAIVVLNAKSGEILAAAGKSDPFHSFYEPASIVKMITLAGAIDHGIDLTKIFPLKCEGSLALSDKRILYCGKVHGQVKDVKVATALSCNVAFARIGFAMKPSDLISNLKRAGFDSTLNEAFLPFPLGRIAPQNPSDLYLAKLSIGLDYLEMTPLHAALYAAAIGNEGTCILPRMLLERRNIIGLPFGAEKPEPYRAFMSREAAAGLITAMEEVVRHPEGTGHRAAIDGFPFAMKTGTAGKAAQGYNSIIIGIAPTPDPKIAFSIFLEHAGKAEFEGARITKLFLESIRGYI